jgi:Rieske Fe-S protein
MPDHDQPESPDLATARPTPTSRRSVLRTAGLVALTGGGATALAACSADGETTSAPSSSAPSAPASSSPPSPSATSAEASETQTEKEAQTEAPKAPTGPSVDTSDVPVGGGVVLKDADYVVTQPTKGDFKAFSKICTHKGCPVAEVTGAEILCKCHGSRYSIKDGSVTNPPANQGLKESKVTVFKKKAYIST